MRDTRRSIKHENIVKYWKDKISENQINVSWEKSLTHCWACGKEGEKGKLERSHIIPHALGGRCSEENLLLMCSECNVNNPETIYYEDFWLWVKNRNNKIKINICDDDPPLMKINYEFMYGNFDIDFKIIKGLYGNNVGKMLVDFLDNNKDKFQVGITLTGGTQAVAFRKFFSYYYDKYYN